MITIETYHPKYKEQCLTIFKSNMPQYFLLEELGAFSNWLDEKASDGRYFVGLKNKEVVACGGYYYDDRYQKAGLSWGMVDAQLHGTGIGSQLTSYRIQQMVSNFPNQIYMIDTSQHTFKFYQKLGFVIKEITPDGFGKGMDKYYMELQVEHP